MTEPLPNWRVFSEDTHGMILEVDVTATERIYVTVPERTFGTEAQNSLIQKAVADYRETQGTVATPGDGPEVG